VNTFFDQVASAGLGQALIRKETWSTPCLLKVESSIKQQEEETLYRALLEMDENEFRFLSGSGK